MTSGNVSDEPIAYDDEDACERLADIADLFLLHDRPIETRTDDSVVRVVGRAAAVAAPLARLRAGLAAAAGGLRPPPARLRRRAEEHVRAGQGTAAPGSGHHVGDLKNYETLRSFTTGIDHFQRLFAVEPEVVAHDLHPEYLSTKHALELDGVRLDRRAAPPRASRGVPRRARRAGPRGRARSSTARGYGDRRHGLGRRAAVRRPRGLRARRPPVPGAACRAATAAVRQPWRMACAWLTAALRRQPRCRRRCADAAARLVAPGGRAGAQRASPRRSRRAPAGCSTRSPRCAASAREVNYEGQAAVELEAAADPAEPARVPAAAARRRRRPLVLDARPTIRAIVARPGRGVAGARPSPRASTTRSRARPRDRLRAPRPSAAGTTTVVLSGGVFQNRRLLERARARSLEAAGCACWCPRRCRRTTAASPTGSSPWRPRGWRGRDDVRA